MTASRTLNALGRHVVLVGFMGAGKTTLGRDAAARLGREFLDLDRAIEERAGKTIPELFEERGESGFREIERHAARVALATPEPARDRARRRRRRRAPRRASCSRRRSSC